MQQFKPVTKTEVKKQQDQSSLMKALQEMSDFEEDVMFCKSDDEELESEAKRFD